MRRAAIYTRISEKDEKFDKVELQEKRLRRVAASAGYKVVRVYTDDGVSGYLGKKRPAFIRLQGDIRAGRIDVVLAAAQDRLTRQKAELEAFQVLCATAGVKWHFATGGEADPADAMSAALLSLGGVLAQLESDLKRVRLRARFDEEAASGRPLWGVRPFGYKADRLRLEPSEAAQVRWAYDTILNGGTLYTILKRWNDLGIRTTRGNQWSYATVQNLLKRPRNAGIVVRQDRPLPDVEAQWDSLVDRPTYDAVVAILSDPQRRTAPGRKPRHLLSSIVRCGCGAVMRSSTGNGESVYKCESKMNAQRIDGRHSSIATRLIDGRVRAAVIDALFAAPTDAFPEEDMPPEPVDIELAKVRSRRQELLNLVAEGVASAAEVAKRLADLNAQLTALESEQTDAMRKSARGAVLLEARRRLPATGEIPWEDAVGAKAALAAGFDSLDLKAQRELVRSLLDVTVYSGRSPRRVQIEHIAVPTLNEDGAA